MPASSSKNRPSEGPADLVQADEYLVLDDRIAALIERSDLSELEFNQAALAVHRFQRTCNQPFANYCRHLGIADDIADWRAIPAVPQSAFKRFALRTFSAEETVTTFRTSGTTGEGYGEHHFRSTRLYDAAILRGWDTLQLPTAALLILAPSPEEAPHSSLTHMLDVLRRERGTPASQFILEPGGQLDLQRFYAAVDSCFHAHQPVGLLGTALAFLHLLDQMEDGRIIRRRGSFVMETGGFKGSGRDITKAELYARFGEHFELKPDGIFNEYGMTELSSQCYTRGLDQPHRAPPWMRVLIIDPETGREVAIGETGVLRLYDLANLGSVLAIQTQDLAVRRERGFELLGRDPAALPRGCSRAADERMQS